MTSDLEAWPPPNDPSAFEALSLDLWKEIWGPHSEGQKNGRSGQPQAGVDVYGQKAGDWIGVQCKQKDGVLRSRLIVTELEEEVEKAKLFRPSLSEFVVATTGPSDVHVQKRARELTEEHRSQGLFSVEIWPWERIWHEIYERQALLRRIGPIYWPKLFALRGERQRIAPSRLPRSAIELFGRETELARLEAAWDNPKVHVVTLVAWGGVGKTSLVAQWQADLAARDYDGADYFDWSFYSQGTREQGGASSDTFIAEALRFFGDPEMAASTASPWDKGARLAQLVAERRALLILDGLEPLQYPPGPLAGQLKDPPLISLLKGLAQGSSGLCVVTTRESVADLAVHRRGTAPEWKLESLATPAGVRLLMWLRVWGSEADLNALVEDVDGHALTLNVLGLYLHQAHGGDVRRRDRVDLQRADRAVQGGHAFKAMAAYERWLEEGREEGARQLAVLRLMGLFESPADDECLTALRRQPAISGLTEMLVDLVEEDWKLTCSALGNSGLLFVTAASSQTGASTSYIARAALDAHPLLREYFACQLRERRPQAWSAGHNRLFEHLRDRTEHHPDTLEGLQPLYHAVTHGCHAGRQQEACSEIFWGRISRGQTGYVVNKLGAFGADLGAIVSFFERPWSHVSPALSEAAQAWLLNEAAFRLVALGRLSEAREPLKAGLLAEVKAKDWKNAAIRTRNLSELELTLGNVSAALGEAKRSATFADRSRDPRLIIVFRTTRAHTLHQAGHHTEALALFSEAEDLQAKWPEHQLLFSLRGFLYCDVLLAGAERAAWQRGREIVEIEAASRVTRNTEIRAMETLQIAQRNDWLLAIALDHLTIGRSRLYRSILEFGDASSASPAIEEAVNGLRRSGSVNHIPRGLLTRSWLRCLEGNHSVAQADLDEAQEIAERGPMPLFLADIHLHRARLFHDRDALAAARRLIERHGYWRRKEELEDAEEMATTW